MGRASRAKRDRRELLALHDAGDLVCGNCGHGISPNEISFSCDVNFTDGVELLVSCYRCAPSLMLVLDEMFGTGRTFQDGWQRHCAGGVDCFDGYDMRSSAG